MKYIIFILLFLSSQIVKSQNYYSLIQEDETKFIVTYDTTADGIIKVIYTPSQNYFNSILQELDNIENDITKIQQIIDIQNERLRILLGKKNKLIKLRNSQ